MRSKSIPDPVALGAELREKRKRLRRTLHDIQRETSVNVGQLSRFERGSMKFMSSNLQKFIDILQGLEMTTTSQHGVSDIVGRFAVIMKRSERHARAGTALVDALERLK